MTYMLTSVKIGLVLVALAMAPSAWAQPHVTVLPDRVLTGHGSDELEFVPRFATFLPDAIEVPVGETVTLTGEITHDAIEVAGTLRCTSPLTLRVIHLLVLPGGALDCTGEGIVIIFRDVPIDRTRDPFAKGNGLISFGPTRIGTHGPAVPAFARMANATAGATVLTLPKGVPTTWDVGNELLIPDTRQVSPGSPINGVPLTPPRREARVFITATTANTITLSKPLDFDHLTPKDLEGVDITCPDGPLGPLAPCGPFVANMTRDFVLKSENPAGTRGHVIVMGHEATFDVDGALFADIGRTQARDMDTGTAIARGNTIGAYAFHAHFANGHGSRFSNSSVLLRSEDRIRWGVAIHQTHDAVIENNVIVGAMGAGIALEDGPEQRTRVVGNLIGYTPGNGKSSLQHVVSGNCSGCEGAGIWISAPVTTLEDNVTINNTIGITAFFRNRASAMVPSVPGGPYDKFYTQSNYNKDQPLLLRTVALSNLVTGVELWDMHMGAVPHAEGLYVIYNGTHGIQMGPASRSGLWVKDFHAHGVPVGGRFPLAGIHSTSAYNSNLRVEGGAIVGFTTGAVDVRWEMTLRNLLMQNVTNVDQTSQQGPWTTLFDHVTHRPIPGKPPRFIRLGNGQIWLGKGPFPSRTKQWSPSLGSMARIINWQGTGQDYRLYEPQQLRSNPAWPSSATANINSKTFCPERDITMGQCWDRYGTAFGGGVVRDEMVQSLTGLIDTIAVPALVDDSLPPARAVMTYPTSYEQAPVMTNGQVRLTIAMTGGFQSDDYFPQALIFAKHYFHIQIDGGPVQRVELRGTSLDFPVKGYFDTTAVSEGPHTVVTWRETEQGQRIESSRMEFGYVIGASTPVPVNCVPSAWSAWSACLNSSQARTRTVVTPASGGGAPCPALIETQACLFPPPGERRIACAKDTANNRAMSFLLNRDPVLTMDKCIAAAKKAGFRYAGVYGSRGNYCLGGNTYDKNGTVDLSECNVHCTGEPVACGGNYLIGVLDAR